MLQSETRNLEVRIRLSEPLEPGAARRVELDFLDPQTALTILKPGAQFSLWEGKEIGLGRIEALREAGPLAAE